MKKERKRGFLAVIEGGDGCGKTTQVDMLVKALRKLGLDVVASREPGGTPLGERLRRILKDDRLSLSAVEEMFLFSAARRALVDQVVTPALEAGKVVVLDRFWPSTYAYQGARMDETDAEVLSIIEELTLSVHADVCVVLDLPPKEALARLGLERDLFESRDVSFHEAVRKRYLKLARRLSQEFVVVPAGASPDAVHKKVLKIVLARLKDAAAKAD
jgi:dTMP kinase